MKILIEFLSLPVITRIIGSKTIVIDYPGAAPTIAAVVNEVCQRYGEKVRQFLLDGTGRLEPTLKIMLNKKEWITPGQMDRPLQEGDSVTIMMLVGGG